MLGMIFPSHPWLPGLAGPCSGRSVVKTTKLGPHQLTRPGWIQSSGWSLTTGDPVAKFEATRDEWLMNGNDGVKKLICAKKISTSGKKCIN